VANLYGILAVAAVQGSLVATGMWVAGVGSPLLLGIAAAICSPIPLVGTALVWVPVVILQLVAGYWLKALLLAIWCSAVVGTADNIIRPLIIVGRMKLHPVPLVFGLIGGVREFGIIGLFIGPLVMSLAMAIIKMLREDALVS
jgi:predicted PurR-regulated permease PerM